MSEIQPIIDLLSDVQKSFSTGGALVGFSAILYALIKFIRLPLVQDILKKISPKASWDAWPKWVRMGCVFGLSAIGALLASVAAGTPWLGAIPGAIVAGLGAMGIDGAVSSATNKPNPIK